MALTALVLDSYLNHIHQDYTDYQSRCNKDADEVRTGIMTKMNQEFKAGLRYEIGRKYIKVIDGTRVHSFIVIRDDKKWKSGDILMAASWNSPATNFSRGNVLAGELSRVSWTGAN